jgi:small subunit ribosomal protein S4
MPRVLEKKERSLGVKLSIRGKRAESPKSALLRKPYRPGQHGKKYRQRLSEFGVQLQEKQKIKFSYGLTDKQLKRIFEAAAKKADSAIRVVTETLESRLDNALMRLGFFDSRSIARQAVSHGHFLVNGRRVKIPSYHLKPGDVITIRPASRHLSLFQDLPERLKNYEVPPWLELDKTSLTARVVSSPKDVELPFDINLVVDFYSKK